MMMTLAQMKKLFFDTRKITDPAERAKWSVLGRFGGRVRLRSRQSMRRAPWVHTATGFVFGRGRRPQGLLVHQASAVPPAPPYYHDNPLLARGPLGPQYGFDKAADSVVVGPSLINGGDGKCPRLLEHGGDAVRVRVTKKFRTRQGRVRVEFDTQSLRQHYAGNPYMQPAFETELPAAAAALGGEIK